MIVCNITVGRCREQKPLAYCSGIDVTCWKEQTTVELVNKVESCFGECISILLCGDDYLCDRSKVVLIL